MDFNMTANLQSILSWAQANMAILIIGLFVFIQYVAFQALLIHYTLFRRSLKRPRPDGLRFQQIEKTLAFHAEQMDRIFEKIAETRKDLVALTKVEPMSSSQRANLSPVSVEASFLSLGELNLKKKLEAFRQS